LLELHENNPKKKGGSKTCKSVYALMNVPPEAPMWARAEDQSPPSHLPSHFHSGINHKFRVAQTCSGSGTKAPRPSVLCARSGWATGQHWNVMTVVVSCSSAS
jgi:hypothetical protein